MDRRKFLTGCSCCGLLGAVPGLAEADGEDEAKAKAEAWAMPPRLVKPELGTDEGGLWAMLDREEAKLRRSRFVLRDQALNDYVNKIVCRLGGEHCPDVRVYIVRSPYFNANMAPNGMMQVWTGLLLRMSNEAQLATVLAHEIGHYLARHTVDRLRDIKSRSAFGQFLGIALGVAGVGGLAPLAQLALTASLFAYERDQEREADRIGLELMSRAGYDPNEAPKIWAQLLEEIQAEKDWSGDPGERSVLFASHPPAADRQQELVTRATQINVANAQIGQPAYRAVLAPHRWTLLEDELKRRKSGESLALLQRMLKESPNDGDLHYFMGETYRLRAAEGDLALALDAYALAAKATNAPAEAQRSMGMILQQNGDAAGAREAFQRYLARKPGAADAEMIQLYIKGGTQP